MKEESSEGQPQFLISSGRVTLGKRVEKGNYGTVHDGNFDNMKVAIKVLPLGDPDDLLQKYVEREMSSIMRLSHPNIVQTHGFSFGEGSLYIVMEFLSKGDLRQHLSTCLRTQTEIPWRTRIEYALDVARAMQYLHSLDMIHRDLKSANLLIGDEGQIKLCDFGFTREMPTSFSQIETLSAVGTDLWAAPEVLMEDPYTKTADVFSFAMILCELMTYTLPPTRTRPNFFFDAVRFEQRLPSDLPAGYWGILCLCADNEPFERPSFESIIECLEMLRDNSFIQSKRSKRKTRKKSLGADSADNDSQLKKSKKNHRDKAKRHHSAREPLVNSVVHQHITSEKKKEEQKAEEGSKSTPVVKRQKTGPARRKMSDASQRPVETPSGIGLSGSSAGFSRFKDRIEQKLQLDPGEEEVKEILQTSASVLFERKSLILQQQNTDVTKLTKSEGIIVHTPSSDVQAPEQNGSTTNIPKGNDSEELLNINGDQKDGAEETRKGSHTGDNDVEKEKDGDTSLEGQSKSDGSGSEGGSEGSGGPVRVLFESGFDKFKERMELKLSTRKSNQIKELLPRTSSKLQRDSVTQIGQGRERRERRESRSFIMHDRAVVYMTKNISSWFKKKTLTIECSWLNCLRYSPGMKVDIRVIVTCTEASPKKHLNGRVYITTSLNIPKKKEKDQIKPAALLLSKSKQLTTTVGEGVDMKSREQEVVFEEIFAKGATFRGELTYIIPPIEDLLGSSCGKRTHRLCFEYHLSTRAGVVKDPMRGELPISIKASKAE